MKRTIFSEESLPHSLTGLIKFAKIEKANEVNLLPVSLVSESFTSGIHQNIFRVMEWVSSPGATLQLGHMGMCGPKISIMTQC